MTIRHIIYIRTDRSMKINKKRLIKNIENHSSRSRWYFFAYSRIWSINGWFLIDHHSDERWWSTTIIFFNTSNWLVMESVKKRKSKEENKLSTASWLEMNNHESVEKQRSLFHIALDETLMFTRWFCRWFVTFLIKISVSGICMCLLAPNSPSQERRRSVTYK